jgi:DNA polymerase
MDSLEILKFYETSGVGEAIGAAPFNFFEYASVRPKPSGSAASAADAPSATVAESAATAAKIAAACADMAALDVALESFGGCTLKRVATNVVCGAGAVPAELRLLTEIPSGDEDRTGKSGSGEEGAMIAKILSSIGREIGRDAYSAPAVPLRPAGGRSPTDEEAAVMKPFLARRIELVRPKLILCMGTLSMKMLLGLDRPITELRGRIFDYNGIPCACAYSMQFFMANYLIARNAVWEDLKAVKGMLPALFQ